MNDTAIKNFCIWARRELIEQVAVQARRYGIREDGYDPASTDVVEGVPLSPMERAQRAELIRRLGPADADGYKDAYEELIDQAAYTWFNRMVAIRFMELNDRLPSHVRVLSADDGSFRPQVLREALDVGIEGVDQAQVSTLISASDDEALFRYMFLAQCAELSSCMPDVFEPVGASLELLLPEGLLRQGGVVERLVADIPEQDWREGVQIVGWMYQYYNAQLKDEVFASFKKGKKADREAIKPATQLFTPNWIVRYLVENSVGRIWMQSHPNSNLPESMPYFIPDEGDTAPSSNAPTSPERITVMDPACGSGHILVYAFELLARMYEEAGYTRRDVARLVLENNLFGLEIDPRAAQLASFALTMTACNYDSRFLRRGVYPKVVALKDALFEEEELALVPELAERTSLLDAMAHMGECGSLFVPDDADMQAIDTSERKLEGETDLFASKALEKVRQVRANCEPLYEKYSAVVANPPYMGSKNMDKWLSDWVKTIYPNVKGDLFSCFIERNLNFAKRGGQLGFMTPYVWMFIGTYGKLRQMISKEATITSLIQLEYSGFAGATVPICTFTLQKGQIAGYRGGYVRLSDFTGAENQAPRALEAIANPDCGWFYRRDASAFSAIPGSPIAYWATDGIIRNYGDDVDLASCVDLVMGTTTGDNDAFYRKWWEVDNLKTERNCQSRFQSKQINARWYPCNRGGEFRRWYGNLIDVCDWENDGKRLLSFDKAYPRNLDYSFLSGISWNLITSGRTAVRFVPAGCIFDQAGPMAFHHNDAGGIDAFVLLAFLNSSVAQYCLSMLNPTLNCSPGVMGALPIAPQLIDDLKRVDKQARKCVELSMNEWDESEVSADFLHHPLI